MRLTRRVLGYFEKYVEYEMRRKTGTDVEKPFYGWVRTGKKRWHYNQFHPLNDMSQIMNKLPQYKNPQKQYLEPIRDWKIFRGDTVQVLVGKDAGKQGIVQYIQKERNWIYVEGLHCDYKSMNMGKDDAADPGVVIKRELPLLVNSEVKLVDPADNEPTEVEWRLTEENKKVRVSIRTGRIIPLPSVAEDFHEDFTQISTYEAGKNDTDKEDLKKVTYTPSSLSFEQDIYNSMNIKEERKPAKTYWY